MGTTATQPLPSDASQGPLDGAPPEAATAARPKRLGEMLVDAGLLTAEQVGSLIEEARMENVRLGELLVTKGLVTQQDIAMVLSLQLNVPLIDSQARPREPPGAPLRSRGVRAPPHPGAPGCHPRLHRHHHGRPGRHSGDRGPEGALPQADCARRGHSRRHQGGDQPQLSRQHRDRGADWAGDAGGDAGGCPSPLAQRRRRDPDRPHGGPPDRAGGAEIAPRTSTWSRRATTCASAIA